MLTKSELRKRFKNVRDLFFESHPEASKKLAQKLMQVIGPADTFWGSYLPYGSEADPQSDDASLSWSVKWAYPKINGEILDFCTPTSGWDKNEYNIREPGQNSIKIPLKNLRGVLVPGIAFDRKGHRLGSGKGFFDKTLKNYQGTKIGVAYSVQISDTDLPAEAHDIKMDIVVTENEIIHITERKAS